jgi:hypothetical protein
LLPIEEIVSGFFLLLGSLFKCISKKLHAAKNKMEGEKLAEIELYLI